MITLIVYCIIAKIVYYINCSLFLLSFVKTGLRDLVEDDLSVGDLIKKLIFLDFLGVWLRFKENFDFDL